MSSTRSPGCSANNSITNARCATTSRFAYDLSIRAAPASSNSKIAITPTTMTQRYSFASVKSPASAVSHWRCPFRIGFDPRAAGEELRQVLRYQSEGGTQTRRGDDHADQIGCHRPDPTHRPTTDKEERRPRQEHHPDRNSHHGRGERDRDPT